jgi:hypothetical protein
VNTKELADELRKSIEFTIDAHMNYSRKQKGTIRYWDKTTPYAIHPIWCAMTLLTETTLNEETRRTGYLTLLWHDILEDTKLVLPENAGSKVRRLVEELTFESLQQEMEEIWGRSDEAKLLKLYDKTSNLLDGAWMNQNKWNQYVEFTSKLIDFAAERYGELNIVKISRAICRPK